MRSEETLSFYERNMSLCDNIQEFGGIVFTLLAILSVVFSGCIGNDPYQNLTAEDAAFRHAVEELPAGAWAASSIAEVTGDYDTMYQIAKTQKEIDEKRIGILRSIPVSADFQDIKNEYLLSDELSIQASEYEMSRALLLKESNQTMDDYYWAFEKNAMDESTNHSFNADRMFHERYGS